MGKLLYVLQAYPVRDSFLADALGVSRGTVSQIKNGLTWAHVNPVACTLDDFLDEVEARAAR